ncbi:alpha-D-ribose 1-methylphosphonate 5-triphosphate diphosphatase [Alphaproteobacteria bacterium]|jgi:alpha-D-ribose 1-methylphosphonate 5-triphosphate diphosphatase|nr:alpha-D-ribose 1-methylphosphonate 5-triphosphate diphosphatase [Alphaproteobacteria bacterium]
MTGSYAIINAKVVTRDSVIDGPVHIKDGYIARVAGDAGEATIDFEGDYLLPGLIELHTDNVEKHFAPRATVVWPEAIAALASHDNQISGSGITTVLNALGVGDYKGRKARYHALQETFKILKEEEHTKLLRADHMFHLRCEVSDPNLIDLVTPFFDETIVRMVSITDHTPGERQWRDLEKFREYHTGFEWAVRDEDFNAFIAKRQEIQGQCAGPNRSKIAKMCSQKDIALASHDDTTPEHVAMGLEEGVTLSEFPCTMEAARLGHKNGLKIIAGAPNVVRGGSLAGNASALDYAEEGMLDILSSDYMPVSLVHAAFILHQKLGLTLPTAVAKISCNTADALGFGDRGEICEGKRADLVRVTMAGDVPVVRQVWREGERIN